MLTNFFDRPFTLDRIARIAFVAVTVIALSWALGSIWSLLLPFFLAWVTAYLLMPLLYFLERFVKNRIASIAILLILVGGVITGLIAILIPQITTEAKRAMELVQFYDVESLLLGLLPEELRTRTGINEALTNFFTHFNMQEIIDGITKFISTSWDVIASTMNYVRSLAVFFLYLLYLIFILLDYEALGKGIYKITPPRLRPFMRELSFNIDYYLNSYFRGQALIALICGIILAVGFYIMKLPLGITLGLFIGVLNLIPYLQIVGYIPMVMLVGLQSVSTGQNFFVVLAFAALVVFISELAQNLILTPSIHGNRMGIKPAIILLSLTIWGNLLGFVGMLFALPLTMILYTLYMKYIVGEPIDQGPLLEPINKEKNSFRWPWQKKKEVEDSTEATEHKE